MCRPLLQQGSPRRRGGLKEKRKDEERERVEMAMKSGEMEQYIDDGRYEGESQ